MRYLLVFLFSISAFAQNDIPTTFDTDLFESLWIYGDNTVSQVTFSEDYFNQARVPASSNAKLNVFKTEVNEMTGTFK